jgi:hypothetical protein
MLVPVVLALAACGGDGGGIDRQALQDAITRDVNVKLQGNGGGSTTVICVQERDGYHFTCNATIVGNTAGVPGVTYAASCDRTTHDCVWRSE